MQNQITLCKKHEKSIQTGYFLKWKMQSNANITKFKILIMDGNSIAFFDTISSTDSYILNDKSGYKYGYYFLYDNFQSKILAPYLDRNSVNAYAVKFRWKIQYDYDDFNKGESDVSDAFFFGPCPLPQDIKDICDE